MAVQLELRYRGLRSPHKIKLGVSGCARECAEARGKDVGVIATDKRLEHVRRRQRRLHAAPRASCSPRTWTTTTLLQAIDRFLMYYVRTADRLQRTAPWIEEIEGGVDARARRGHGRQPRASPRTSTPRWRRTWMRTRTSGRRRSRTPRSCAGSRRS